MTIIGMIPVKHRNIWSKMFYTNMCCIDSLSDWYCDHSLFYLMLPVAGPPAVSLLVDGEVKDLATHGTSGFPSTSTITQFSECLLPPANEVWSNVIFLHLSVILFTGGGRVWQGGHAWHGGVRGSWAGGMHGRGACVADTTIYGQWAGGTHPTGMHSC